MTPMQQAALLQQVIDSLKTGKTKITDSHLDRYDRLRSNLHTLNVSNDQVFQRTFSGLFRLRYMTKSHRAKFFQLMNMVKAHAAPKFDVILNRYRDETGRWEVSFTSKLIHIIDPSQAIWDSLVSAHLGIKIPLPRNSANCTQAYGQLGQEMNALLNHPLFPDVSNAFNNRFPNRSYTGMRVLDVSIWGL